MPAFVIRKYFRLVQYLRVRLKPKLVEHLIVRNSDVQLLIANNRLGCWEK